MYYETNPVLTLTKTKLATKKYPAQKRLRKYRKDPANLKRFEIADVDLEIIQTIERYRFIPTSLLVRLVNGYPKYVSDRAKNLYHSGYINRFYIPRPGNPGQFIYYLDNKAALWLLIDRAGVHKDSLDFRAVETNKIKAYAKINEPGQIAEEMQGKLQFIQHELDISRFHGVIELACRDAKGMVELKTWKQGSSLYDYVFAPEYASRTVKNDDGRMEEIYKETGEQEHIPVRPDAFFSLAFPSRHDEPEQHFIYERDRNTTNTERHNKKLRGHFRYIVVERRNRQAPLNVQRVRAVLIETTDQDRKQQLWRAAHKKSVSPNPSPLFWFASSNEIIRPVQTPKGAMPEYLYNPLCIFRRHWLPVGERETVSIIDR